MVGIKQWQRFLIVSLISVSSCAGTPVSYSIDPVREVIFNEGETIQFKDIECVEDPRNPKQKLCPVVGIFVDDFAEILQRLRACEQ